MGVSLAKVVLSATWAHLSPPARVLLAHMAIVALDHAKDPVYFGGRDALVLALDGKIEDEPTARDLQYRRLKRHLEHLKAAGAITTRSHAHRRQRAEYLLQVVGNDVHHAPLEGLEGGQRTTPIRADKGGRPATPNSSDKGGHPATPQGGHSTTPIPRERGSLDGQKGGHSATPLGIDEEELQEEDLPGGGIDHVPAQPHLGRAHDPENRRERCAECGRSEQACRARSAPHGGHQYRPIELPALELAVLRAAPAPAADREAQTA